MTSRSERAYLALLFGGIFLLLSVLVVLFELEPGRHPSPSLPFLEGRDATHRLIILAYMYLSGAGALGVLFWSLLRRMSWICEQRVQSLVAITLALIVIISAFFYFYARRGLAEDQFVHRYDSFHYFMAPRYYDEMGYQDLYTCVLQALNPRELGLRTRVRDLRNYQMTTVAELQRLQLCPRDNFSDEQWGRFKQDLRVYTDTQGGKSLVRRAITDRGYNGTPLHAALSGFMADKVTLSIASHNLLPLFDAFLICLMLYAVAAVFGWKIGLLFALSVFTLAADRWAIIGASWFRYAWLVTLAFGLVALRKGRYAWSGFWMTFSALLNVFPAVFIVGIGLRGLFGCLKERRILRRYKRYFIVAALTAVVGLCIGVSPARHFENYTGWLDNMKNHNVERFQGFGVGLKFPFIFRGAITQRDDQVRESERRRIFHDNRAAYIPVAGFILLLAMAFAARTDDDVEASTVLGFTILFCFLGTVAYYFACASLLVLGLHRRIDSTGGTLLLVFWFLSSLLAHWALLETNYYRFMYNTVLSMAWTAWLIALLLWLGGQEGVFRRIARSPLQRQDSEARQ